MPRALVDVLMPDLAPADGHAERHAVGAARPIVDADRESQRRADGHGHGVLGERFAADQSLPRRMDEDARPVLAADRVRLFLDNGAEADRVIDVLVPDAEPRVAEIGEIHEGRRSELEMRERRRDQGSGIELDALRQ